MRDDDLADLRARVTPGLLSLLARLAPAPGRLGYAIAERTRRAR